MIWLRPVDRTSGTLTLSAGTLSCLAHHGTPLSKRCPTTTALEHTTVPMDDADRMPPLGAVKPLCGQRHVFSPLSSVLGAGGNLVHACTIFHARNTAPCQSRSQALPNRGALASGRVR